MDDIRAIMAYISEVKTQLATGHALEHAYRPALQLLLNSLDGVVAVNDPKQSDFGAPDFILLQESNPDVVLGYGEAKDVGVSLDKVERSEQFQRYTGYEKLFVTNYLEFRFYKNGEPDSSLTLAELADDRTIVEHPSSFDALLRLLRDFVESQPTTIRSGQELARIMGAKARRIRDEVLYAVKDTDSEQERLRKTMKKMLVHDLSREKFADLYAQTLVYGLFVARFYDPSPDTFSRAEARDLVPIANPFLRVFFDHISGANFDDKLRRTVEELCQVLRLSDIAGIFSRYASGKSGRTKDPVIYFYEDFLNAYDKKIRMDMGAFYTPLPVVHFIVSAIDQSLKDFFNTPLGLADSSKRVIEIDDGQVRQFKDRETGGYKKTTKQRLEYHRVQILDPAVGTGTFLNEAINTIYNTIVTKGQKGLWNSYVTDSLLPRLHGFEYMMAPYTIAHLKLGLTLREMGFLNEKNKRLGIYLTNSLEPGIPPAEDLFGLIGLSSALSEEAQLASVVKNEKPILVILGNPPYLGESNNRTKYAEAVVDKYRLEPGTDLKLQESNYKWLGNDYVKFLASAQDKVDELGEGIVGMITPNSYLSMPTFRGMRYSLLKSFDRLYILDLNGSLRSRDTADDGRPDKNVFDIETGVAILIAVKADNISRDMADVFHFSIKGSRQEKFDFLENGNVGWVSIEPRAPMYAFRQQTVTEVNRDYENFIALKALFPLHSLGLLTKRDKLTVAMTRDDLSSHLDSFFDSRKSTFEACQEFGLKEKDSDKWDADKVRREVDVDEAIDSIESVHFRPFDERHVAYHELLIARRNTRVLAPMCKGNLALVVGRQGQAVKDMEWNLAFVVDKMTDQNIFGRGGGTVFPLYVSPGDSPITNLDAASLRALSMNLGSAPRRCYESRFSQYRITASCTEASKCTANLSKRVAHPRCCLIRLIPRSTALRRR